MKNFIRKNFIRKKENFKCDNCGAKVYGNGFTNHCPNCLYSKHVDDIVPGDRQSKCQGIMKPIGLEIKNQKYIIIHQCQNCGKETKNKAAGNDNFKMLLKISAGITK